MTTSGNHTARARRPNDMHYRLRIVPLLVALAVVLAACGTDEPESSDEPDTPVTLDGAWVLAEATIDGSALALNDEYRVTMTLDGEMINGRAACNGYSGAAVIEGNSFSVGPLAQTMMACEPAVMDIEFRFMQGLARVTDASRSSERLSLTGVGIEFTFELLAPVPTADLVGPTWVLDTIVQGEAATSTAASADPATLTLSPDGTFVGNTGCREISGEYVVSGDTVQFTSWAAQGDCSSELTWQDGQVITVLEGSFTVGIEGDRLTLTSSGGEALQYRIAT